MKIRLERSGPRTPQESSNFAIFIFGIRNKGMCTVFVHENDGVLIYSIYCSMNKVIASFPRCCCKIIVTSQENTCWRRTVIYQ